MFNIENYAERFRISASTVGVGAVSYATQSLKLLSEIRDFVKPQQPWARQWASVGVSVATLPSDFDTAVTVFTVPEDHDCVIESCNAITVDGQGIAYGILSTDTWATVPTGPGAVLQSDGYPVGPGQPVKWHFAPVAGAPPTADLRVYVLYRLSPVTPPKAYAGHNVDLTSITGITGTPVMAHDNPNG